MKFYFKGALLEFEKEKEYFNYVKLYQNSPITRQNLVVSLSDFCENLLINVNLFHNKNLVVWEIEKELELALDKILQKFFDKKK